MNNPVVEIRRAEELGSVVGPVIQANGRLMFEDDLRSGHSGRTPEWLGAGRCQLCLLDTSRSSK